MTQLDFGFVASPAGAADLSDGDLYRDVLADIAFQTDLGYDTVWMIEHHFSDYFPCPSPLLFLSHVAALHPDVNLGTCVLVTPWYNPLRLAEEIAMLSALTRGQLHIGIGRGTAKYEYDAFDLDMATTREQFAETWDIVRTALEMQPFTYDGSIHSVPKRIRIRPNVATDRIHFYGAIGSPASATVMAELGLAPICTTIGDYDAQRETLEAWDKRAVECGVTATATRPIMINCVIADSDAEAIEQAQRYIPAFMHAQVAHYTPEETNWEELPAYAGWKGQFAGMQRKTDPANIPAWCTFQLVGSPDTVAAKVQSYADAGFDHLFLHTATAGIPFEVRSDWVKRFAQEVAPAFNRRFT
jgi:alkanesulfonate monooxygenase SsuD/methylene tetrahydromethanopterin reductase-like flavin-dependent oxidoreductase (luciferase family)